MAEPEIVQVVDDALADHFGHRAQRASVSFLGVDRLEVLRFEPIPGERAYVSLGMSRHPMTAAADPVLAADGPRAELMLHLRDPGDRHADVWRSLAVLAAAPSVEGVVYIEGMTIDLGQPLVEGSSCVGVVIEAPGVQPAGMAAVGVQLLRAIPATSTELAWCRVRGAPALLARWGERDVDLLDLTRRAVDLE